MQHPASICECHHGWHSQENFEKMKTKLWPKMALSEPIFSQLQYFKSTALEHFQTHTTKVQRSSFDQWSTKHTSEHHHGWCSEEYFQRVSKKVQVLVLFRITVLQNQAQIPKVDFTSELGHKKTITYPAMVPWLPLQDVENGGQLMEAFMNLSVF